MHRERVASDSTPCRGLFLFACFVLLPLLPLPKVHPNFVEHFHQPRPFSCRVSLIPRFLTAFADALGRNSLEVCEVRAPETLGPFIPWNWAQSMSERHSTVRLLKTCANHSLSVRQSLASRYQATQAVVDNGAPRLCAVAIALGSRH